MSEIETEVPEQPKSYSLLAAEMFPHAYKGEVKEPETVTIEEGAEIEAEPIEGEELTVEAESEAETLTTDEPEEETEEANTLEDIQAWLAQEKELDVNFDDALVTLKINGKEEKRSISELKANSQKLEAADDILESAKAKAREERTAFYAELEAKNQQATESLTMAATLVQSAEKVLADERESIDWEKLRVEDKAEYALKREEFKERQEVIDQIKQDAAGMYQNWQVQSQQEAEAARQEHLIAEQERLLERLPEWSNEEVASKEKGQVVNYLQSIGFTNEEISQAGDHRLILLARDAMLYRNQSETVETTRKKIAKIPKVVKPGTQKTADQRNSAKIQRLEKVMREKPTPENAFALLQAKQGK